jgi:hypothetical protein
MTEQNFERLSLVCLVWLLVSLFTPLFLPFTQPLAINLMLSFLCMVGMLAYGATRSNY